ncbi:MULTISPECIES: tRNA epoxyqueuosine(34) reductase QueG [Asaia]|uniref:Epoxyqueuosine reductase n=1 Tax=Asaia bogorensis TaxID=91915 RepID=A0A060QLC0_9PROT|nr:MULTISPECIES: tRNA epoxyqueuosine(34) reductase QueG [Asaia]ETC98181.1 4Fe-4S ferredoxin [Asaia sp. SF2.1]MDL2171683.1 tRNA epoxyqueuosine(34) reductase QueG [Asaia sp. HumB]CDG40187.1 Epoxyqueuosine (oQ) reductase QueG [Asaia bogorensis]
MSKSIEDRIADHARHLGFDAIGFCDATLPEEARTRLKQFVEDGRHGTMSWMEQRIDQRGDPKALWPEVRSVISLGLSYAPEADPAETLDQPDKGTISVYARHRDYHDVLKGMLKHLAQFVVRQEVGGDGTQVKVFVDTAPVMEKPLAEQAQLGWQGKHTNVVSRDHGSWLLLGEIYTTLDLTPSPPRAGSCGSCTRCLTACPTDAFPRPYALDARRCIAYLTIEHDGPIPVEFRKAMGNRIYGCDDCLNACPWNRFAATSRHMKLQPRADLMAPRLEDLARLDDAGFRSFFSGSPIKRIGRNRFVRNVLIALGNSHNTDHLALIETLTGDENPMVAEAAEWARAELLGQEDNE